MNRSTSRKSAISIVAISGLVGAALSFGVSASIGDVTGRQAALSTLKVFSADQRANDVLPVQASASDLGAGGIVSTTSRLLGVDNRARYWVAIDEQNEVCVVALLNEDSKSAAACTDAQRFLSRGVSIGVGAARQRSVAPADAVWVEAYVVPDGKIVAGIVAGLRRLSPNLVAGDSRETAPAVRASQQVRAGVSDKTFTLYLLEEDQSK